VAIYPVKEKSASIFFHKSVALGIDRAGRRKLLTLYKKIDNCRSRGFGSESLFFMWKSTGVMEWWSNGVMIGLITVEIRALAFSNTPTLQDRSLSFAAKPFNPELAQRTRFAAL
jgi:hypothetical protein